MKEMDVCPGAYHCSDGSHGYSAIPPALHNLPIYAALISSSLSVMGAALNMTAYCAFKDLRKGTAQTIIAVLAMADFFLASSCFFGASLHLAYGTKINTTDNMLSDKDCYNFDTLCQIQAFLGMWMLGCSFTWTSVLAVHFFLVIICTRSIWPHKLMPLYNIVAWLVPLAYTLPMLLLGKLGYNTTLMWTCFMRYGDAPQWDIQEMASTVWIILAYSCLLFTVFLKSRGQVRKVSKRMLTFLIAFVLLRIWDVAAIIINYITKSMIPCSSQHIQITGFIIITVLAVAEPGQGWINCILYIFLSAELRKRMFVWPFQRVWRRLVKKTEQRQRRDREISPLLGDTTNPLSAPARRQGGTTDGGTHTYLSFPTEFSCSDYEA